MNRTPSGKLKVSTPTDLQIVLTREFAAPRTLVFDAFTQPEHLRRWLGLDGGEMTVCEVDLRVGGAWRYRWRLLEGGEMGMYGEFIEIAAPQRLVQTEQFEEPYFEMMGAGTLNTMALDERGAGTSMTLTILYKTREARDAVLQSPAAEGAGMSFDRLEELLRAVDR